MGRPRLPNARRVPISIRVSEKDAAKIDRLRGKLSRSDWVRQVVDQALDADGE